jgi:hypothetical protein
MNTYYIVIPGLDYALEIGAESSTELAEQVRAKVSEGEFGVYNLGNDAAIGVNYAHARQWVVSKDHPDRMATILLASL